MSKVIVEAIENGSFPDDEGLLNSQVEPGLLDVIKGAKEDLIKSVTQISKGQAGDVDSWIEQARRVQADIARCKEDYKHIVQEHGRIEALRTKRDESRNKSSLLHEEIAFTEALQKQINLIAHTSSVLNEIDLNTRCGQYFLAATALKDVDSSIQSVQSEQSRSLLTSMQLDLRDNLTNGLESTLDAHYSIQVADNSVEVTVHQKLSDDSTADTEPASLLDALSAFSLLGSSDHNARTSKRLQACLLPYMHRQSRMYLDHIRVSEQSVQLRTPETPKRSDICKISLSRTKPEPVAVVRIVADFLRYVQDRSPPEMLLVNLVSAGIVPSLIVNWVDLAIPAAIDDLPGVQSLILAVAELSQFLDENRVREAHDLNAWVHQVPRTWLMRRRAASLDAVRAGFKSAMASTRQVERVETQAVVVEAERDKPADTEDDWAENWDDDTSDDQAGTSHRSNEEDGSDAWGFDADEEDGPPKGATGEGKHQDEGDEADAWGWGDEEDDSKPPTAKSPTKKSTARSNGITRTAPKTQDVTLTEMYTITDIPDAILEQIGRDISDFQALTASPKDYFPSSSTPPSGFQNLPTLILAMFRAMAPDHYTSASTLTRMNLYNDTLYIIQSLTSSAINPSPSLQADISTMNKFARQTYTSELSQQRTIIHDLLDNAQGFTSCTVEPYLSQCESAISSTTDYIRALHKQYSAILSPSHLAQSIGSLLSSVMSKMIKDIEDIEDIQETESKKLVQFMQQISQLEDLFLAQPPAGTALSATSTSDEDTGPISTIALHCSNYLRFEYLKQILEGSLADIKMFWTEAGLSIEFSADEVVDLIKALFAESSHRRNAIQVIRGSGGR